MTDYSSGIEQAWEEGQGVRYVWICNLCGQPLPIHGTCNSGIHVPPGGDGDPRFIGKPIKSIDAIKKLRDLEEDRVGL